MPQPKKYATPAARQAAYHQRQQQARRRQLEAKGLCAVPALATVPGYPRWRQAITQSSTLLELVQLEMEDYADQRSEHWNETERADTFRQQIEDVAAAYEQVNELDL